jgi:rhodanese-related sulfurtransferase
MKKLNKHTLFFLAAIIFANNACAQEKLSAKTFSDKLKATPNAFILDVRTPAEVNRSYIKNAVFMDIHDSLFEKKISTIDKKLSVFVYCAIGVRSNDAAVMLHRLGFNEVYDLKGGIINWKLAGLPIAKGKDYDDRKGMSKNEFLTSIKDKPLAFIDFYAPWCAPCQVMVPALDSMKIAIKDSVFIVKINADENLGLMKELDFNNLPYIMMYKNGENIFRQDGFMSRRDMEANIRKAYSK